MSNDLDKKNQEEREKIKVTGLQEIPADITDEIKTSYLNYAMSVIIGRAIPDVRDGLKPVHRRALYSMYKLGNTHDKPYKKSARIVGDTLGKYHPHGDTAVYDTIVRMAQDFSYRYPLVDGQGNFGSIDGDSAAAMRYTEVRMSLIAQEMLADIKKDTVDFIPNFDNSLEEPSVLPAPVPQLLINGSSGIAVGMATNIPPHNLGEVIDACVLLIDRPEAPLAEIMKVLPGPDFPTGATICGVSGIKEAYQTGKGIITLQAKVISENIEKKSQHAPTLVVKELPYQVNKAALVERIAALVQDKKITDITALRDESDRNGMRIVIELKKNANHHIILNNLFKHTNLQTTFGINMMAIVEGRPKQLSLLEALHYFLNHRKTVVVRRSQYDLKQAQDRAHILEGLKIALANIDEVIQIIKKSKDVDTARQNLIKQFQLSEKQAQAILDMRLQRLTSLEIKKLEEEYLELIKKIAYLQEILADERKLMLTIRDELIDLKNRYADNRLTQIVKEEKEDFVLEDFIAEEDIVITYTKDGYLKRLPLNTYRKQRRGGRGVIGMGVKEEDLVDNLYITTNLHDILFFSNKGTVYRRKAYQIPEGGRTSRGIAVVNLLGIQKGEKITTVIPIREEEFEKSRETDDLYLYMATRQGKVKKVALHAFASLRNKEIAAISLVEGDELIRVRLSGAAENVILTTRKGKSAYFSGKQIRPMGRTAMGCRGITLAKNDYLIDLSMVQPDSDEDILLITENGSGKRTPLKFYRLAKTRGGKGVKSIQLNKERGEVVSVKVVNERDELVLISQKGIIIRVPVREISRTGRNSIGVKVMNLDQDDKVASVATVPQSHVTN
ncbi:MAG: DNA gyrase subunit A [Candidatus Atribacteria bacterium]|nr:DNA gyrase subunit A [Candidatus Atribacteria bacterium]